MGSLRMLIVFIVLLPFIKIEFLKGDIGFLLLGFGFFMGFMTNVFLNLSIYVADILAPTIIGSQLSIYLVFY